MNMKKFEKYKRGRRNNSKNTSPPFSYDQKSEIAKMEPAESTGKPVYMLHAGHHVALDRISSILPYFTQGISAPVKGTLFNELSRKLDFIVLG